jgi:hypothetical protein
MTISRRNRINGQWSARLIEMLESPAYRALSLSAHRIISRIEIELGHHGGNDNDKLPVTCKDFIEYGVDRAAVAPAIREAEALGFIRVTEHGHGGNREFRKPNLFRLTFAHGRDSRSKPPSHEWRNIQSTEEALEIARAARPAAGLTVSRVPTSRHMQCSKFGAYSITSSARPSSCAGTSSPRAVAAFKLITNLNFTRTWTGSSLGFVPLRIRSA